VQWLWRVLRAGNLSGRVPSLLAAARPVPGATVVATAEPLSMRSADPPGPALGASAAHSRETGAPTGGPLDFRRQRLRLHGGIDRPANY